jgi:hypothetical protein
MQLLFDLGYTKFKLVQQANVAGRTIKPQTLDGTSQALRGVAGHFTLGMAATPFRASEPQTP